MNARCLAGHHREADVAVTASGHEPVAGAGRVGPHHHRPPHHPASSATWWPAAISAGSWIRAASSMAR